VAILGEAQHQSDCLQRLRFSPLIPSKQLRARDTRRYISDVNVIESRRSGLIINNEGRFDGARASLLETCLPWLNMPESTSPVCSITHPSVRYRKTKRSGELDSKRVRRGKLNRPGHVADLTSYYGQTVDVFRPTRCENILDATSSQNRISTDAHRNMARCVRRNSFACTIDRYNAR
jgi:hypothetical protein